MKTYIKITLLLIGFGIFVPANCQKPEPKSKIKSLIVFDEKSDMLIKKQYKDSETYYDAKGNILEEITYKQGKISKHFKYQYDADDNKIKEEEFDASGRRIESSEYKIENGFRTEKNVYDANKKLKSKKTYVYTTY
jgi:hypothetical protein